MSDPETCAPGHNEPRWMPLTGIPPLLSYGSCHRSYGIIPVGHGRNGAPPSWAPSHRSRRGKTSPKRLGGRLVDVHVFATTTCGSRALAGRSEQSGILSGALLGFRSRRHSQPASEGLPESVIANDHPYRPHGSRSVHRSQRRVPRLRQRRRCHHIRLRNACIGVPLLDTRPGGPGTGCQP